MDLLLDGLNDKQKEAALCVEENVRIIAGAGSGKTQVLMARIEYLLKELHVYPNRILAITFTNKAAREMKERLFAQVGDLATQVRISTIHALCTRILREDAQSIGYPKNFTILDADDQRSLLRRIAKELDINLKTYPDAMNYIAKWKKNNMDPQKIVDAYQNEHSYGAKVALTYGLIYQKYMKYKDEMRALDFDDLLQKADELLKRDETVRQKWQNRLDYIHVDEFQDVDPIQYSLLQSLYQPQTKLAVVGDPDQTIYTWRGACVDLILHFDEDFGPVKTVILNENYRSTSPILSASNTLIACNRNRIPKDLFTNQKGEEPIGFFFGKSQDEEASKTIREILTLHRKEKYQWKDIAVLYRANYLSRALEKELQLFGIPYKLIGGIRFFERAEIKDMLSYLKLLANPDPNDPKNMSVNLAVERVLNTPRRGIGEKTLEELRKESDQRGINMLEVMKDPLTLKPAARKKLQFFASLIEHLKKQLQQRIEEEQLPKIIDDILKATKYEVMLQEEEGGDLRLENLQEMQQDLEASIQENPELTLEQYLQEVALLSEASHDEEGDVVTLMTVHAAKGTEFPIVFINTVNDSIFPSARSIEENLLEGMEEERRLMYVAMTRAKKKLYISYNTDYSYQTGEYRKPSPFINELKTPLHSLFNIDKKQDTPKAQEKRASQLKKASFPASSVKKRKGTPIKAKSKVYHPKFGKGQVVSLSGDIATVIFEQDSKPRRIKENYLEVIK